MLLLYSVGIENFKSVSVLLSTSPSSFVTGKTSNDDLIKSISYDSVALIEPRCDKPGSTRDSRCCSSCA